MGIRYESTQIDLTNPQLDQVAAVTIYCIVQDQINNLMKHAVTEKIIVRITNAHDQLAVTVEDEGEGFRTTILSHSKGTGWQAASIGSIF